MLTADWAGAGGATADVVTFVGVSDDDPVRLLREVLWVGSVLAPVVFHLGVGWALKDRWTPPICPAFLPFALAAVKASTRSAILPRAPDSGESGMRRALELPESECEADLGSLLDVPMAGSSKSGARARPSGTVAMPP